MAKTKSTISPLLRASFEFLDHGLFHYLRSETSIDMKFAILHIDQSIELMLKEKVRSTGHSIFKSPKETISIWKAYDILIDDVKCAIPEKSDLEMLHEERNNIQHKYSNPTAQDTAFIIEKAYNFIKRFAKDELSVDVSKYLTSSHIEEME